jgi:hypothetical protein
MFNNLFNKSKNSGINANSTTKVNVHKAINSVFNKNMNKNMNSNKNIKNFNYNLFLQIFVIAVIVILIIYFIMLIINYYTIKCYKRKGFLEYLFDYTNYDVCHQKYEPIIIPKKNPKVEPITIPSLFESPKEEVFHISNQDFTYEQSKCKCASYGGRLATKNEVTDAYNKGANWCTYGWTEGQNAYYPVQKCFWDKVESKNQRLPRHKQTYCGLPGLNGGFFANPELKFGINCYGVKPKGSLVKAKKPECSAQNFCSLDANYQASNKLDTDDISGFSDLKWNEY